MATEQRENARAHVLRRARIVFGGGYSAIDCVVLDTSPQGARLRVGSWLGLPDSFELRMANGTVHQAQVRFRRIGEIGVEFSERLPPDRQT